MLRHRGGREDSEVVTSEMFMEGQRWREWGKMDAVEGIAAMAPVWICLMAGLEGVVGYARWAVLKRLLVGDGARLSGLGGQRVSGSAWEW